MTKNKAVSSNQNQRRLNSQWEVPAKQTAVGPQAAIAASSPRRRRLSNEQIGEVAGKVWQTLSEGGEQSTTALKKSIDAPADLVLAAVGWLRASRSWNFPSAVDRSRSRCGNVATPVLIRPVR